MTLQIRPLSLDLIGRLNNFHLPKSKPLIPLFEAIVNSIHAIEERRKSDANFSDGKIIIRILSEQEKSVLKDHSLPIDIKGFEIEDNGIGFTDQNMNSFTVSDSTYKADIGGKGVGRFTWLKAFDSISVSSVYFDEGVFKIRSFNFDQLNIQIHESIADSSNNFFKTIVKLNLFKSEYKLNLPKNIDTICMRIIEHFLVYFTNELCPIITLIDINNNLITLNDIFKNMTQDDNFDEVKINNNIFNLLHFKVSDKSLKNNRLYLCANNRLIASINLQNHIIDLDEQIYELNNFWYIGILTGSYLDENVDMTRLSFLFPNDSTDIFYSISLTNIIETCQIHIEQYLSSYLVKIIDDKKSKINKFILTNVQQFRHLLTYMSDKVYKIKPKSTNAQIEEHLYHIDHLYRSETKQNIDKLINDLDFFSSDYEQCFNTTLQQINDINRDLLVEYVTHRKFIIKLLEKGIMGTDDGNYQKENYLHQLIYPMKNTSDDLDYDSHNLWLIDDKLSYCRLIYSDSPFNNGSKQVRPDLTILDHPVAVSDDPNEGKSFDTIIIFEIKRPMRNEYNDLNNPIDQLYNYVIKFRSNTLIDIHKRPIHVNESTKFFLYAICDITDNLKTYIDKYDFVESTDKLGFFTYNKKYNAYFEILSYDKLLNDAKKRNRVFFDKLGI